MSEKAYGGHTCMILLTLLLGKDERRNTSYWSCWELEKADTSSCIFSLVSLCCLTHFPPSSSTAGEVHGSGGQPRARLVLPSEALGLSSIFAFLED